MSFKNVTYAVFALLCASFTPQLSASLTLLGETVTDSQVSRVFHVLSAQLPAKADETVETVTLNPEETKDFKALFATPQHHKVILSSKLAYLQKVTDILARRQAATMILELQTSADSVKKLHLAFAFDKEFFRGQLVERLMLTVTTTVALEAEEKEFFTTIIKADGFFVKHAAKALMLLAAGAATYPLTIPGKLRNQRKNQPWMEKLQEVLVQNFTALKAYNNEYHIDIMKTYPGAAYAPSLQGFYDSSWPIFKPEEISIPEKPMIYILLLPCAGALSALAQAGKLEGNANKRQVRILLYPTTQASAIEPEIALHRKTLSANRWLTKPVLEGDKQTDLQTNAQNIFELLIRELEAPFAFTTKPWGSDHLQKLEELSRQNPLWAIHYKTNSGLAPWETKGTVDATSEVIVLTTSSLKSMASLDTMTITVDTSSIPPRTDNIKESLLLVINDTPKFLYADGRLALGSVVNMKRDEGDLNSKPRFDKAFFTLEPTARATQKWVHFATPTPASSTGDNMVTDDADLEVFESDTEKTTLELAYDAASSQMKKVIAAEEARLEQERLEREKRERENKEHEDRSAEIQRQEQEALARVVWKTTEEVEDEFTRFEFDVHAVLNELDKLDVGHIIHDTNEEFARLTQAAKDRKLETEEAHRLSVLTKIRQGDFRRRHNPFRTRSLWNENGCLSLSQIFHNFITNGNPSEQEHHHLIFADTSHTNLTQDFTCQRELKKGKNKETAQNNMLLGGWQVIVWNDLANAKSSCAELEKNTSMISRMRINVGQEHGRFFLFINYCQPANDNPRYTTHKTYQEVVITIAKALIENRRFAEEHNRIALVEAMRHKARETSPSSDPDPKDPTDPKSTRRLPQPGPKPTPPATTSPEETVSLLIRAQHCGSNMDATGIPDHKDKKLFSLTINKWSPVVIRSAKQHGLLDRKYVIFTQCTDDIQTSFFDKIGDDDKKKLFYVVTNYVEATDESSRVTVTTNGSSREMTLGQLRDLLAVA